MKNIIKYIIIFMLVSIPIAFAIDFSPSGDIDGLERYGIKNFTSANATAFYQNGNKVLDDTSNVTATSIDWANVTNKPTNLSNFTDDLGDRGYSVLSNFTDDLGNRGYTVLSNFTDDLGD